MQKTFYTIHIVASDSKDCEDWVLAFRSEPVEMVKRKRDGGSLEYNYFSSRPLVAGPGIIIEDKDPAAEHSVPLLRKLGNAIGLKQSEQFFSLPTSNIICRSPDTRTKLSIFEYHGANAEFDLIANTEFSLATLTRMELGDSTAVRVHANTVGRATLKYVECAESPKYFCLSLYMPNLY